MKRTNVVKFLCWAAVFSLSPELRAQEMEDVVYLKNGSVIRGLIVEQVPGKSLSIRTKDGSIFVHSMDDVIRMTKEAPVGESRGPSTGGFGVGGHFGTDISGGIGFGGGAAYVLVPAGNSFAYEFSLDFFYHGYEETDGGNTENTDLYIFAARTNWLWNYTPNQNRVYFITGAGFVFAMLDWTNQYDPSVYGYSLIEVEDYATAGNIINFGVGYSSASGLGVRLETPMLIFYGAGQSSAFVPTVTLGVRYFF